MRDRDSIGGRRRPPAPSGRLRAPASAAGPPANGRCRSRAREPGRLAESGTSGSPGLRNEKSSPCSAISAVRQPLRPHEAGPPACGPKRGLAKHAILQCRTLQLALSGEGDGRYRTKTRAPGSEAAKKTKPKLRENASAVSDAMP